MGKLIVIEGSDGSGKSTQFKLLTRRLRGVVDRDPCGVGGGNEAAQIPNGDVNLGIGIAVALP